MCWGLYANFARAARVPVRAKVSPASRSSFTTIDQRQRPIVMLDVPIRSVANGPCQCTRHTCVHVRECHCGGVVRFTRNSRSQHSTSVVLCRECAVPHTSQSRGAAFLT